MKLSAIPAKVTETVLSMIYMDTSSGAGHRIQAIVIHFGGHMPMKSYYKISRSFEAATCYITFSYQFWI